ncbi:MAG: hypothetical protein HZC41_04495 [Chloroflexi bacterium]|nr:hypothetical protein [Chloroflexota bacterium]
MAAFSLKWPSAARPARFTTPYDAATGQAGIYAPAGTDIVAGAAGRVITVTDKVVLVQSGGYTTTYSNVRGCVTVGQEVTIGEMIAESLGPESISIMLQQALDISKVLTPPKTDAPKTYVRPLVDRLRVRETPVDGTPLAQAYVTDILESLETAEETERKIGVEGQWLQVRTPGGVAGYVACQYIQASAAPAPLGNILGMNLDIYNRLGRPDPAQMKGIGWIRVKFNVSLDPDRPFTTDNSSGRYGNTDIVAAFNRHRPALEPYARAGIKILMVFTHQLYGEAAGYNWNEMTTAHWRDLSAKYADFARRSVELWKPTGIVHAYQIWNEQDTEPGKGRAAVPVPPADYGVLLAETIRAIRTVDTATPIITGGHCRGPDAGSTYIRAALRAMPPDVRPDGIATHPYGRGVKGHVFSVFGALDEEIRKYAAVLPGKPVWITEWGVLGRQGDVSIAAKVADYATGFMRICRGGLAGPVAAACWYAWADGMDDGYGLVDGNGQPKASFCAPFLAL